MANFVDKQDRISQLQDELLVTILSLLNPVEAASTCVLSKRWQYLWTHVNVVNFYFPKIMMTEKIPEYFFAERWKLREEYIDWVNGVIQSHQGPCITDFKIFFFLTGKKFSCDIEKWFSFAIRKSVQRLEVNLRGSTLVEERLERNIDDLNMIFAHRFSEYKPYTLTDKVNSLIKSPLVADPSLCLKFLEISRCPRLKTIDIYAPKLASLICLGLNRSTQVLVRHAPSLVDLTVGHPERFFKALPANYFSQLESVTLSFDFNWDTSTPALYPVLTNLKNLTFAGFAKEENSFLYWTSLIERSPLLRTFTLQLMPPKRIRTQIQTKPTERRLHRCLEVVKFVGNIDSELLVYFFQHAVALKTIIVDCRPLGLEPWQEFEEDKNSMELRNHALELKAQLFPKIDAVIRP
ncbi:hypothetical protein Vadar_012236 [Vaccinium darrowii]|uniref:Uncharacterized protein n=1 Tax=Vaccinium darrowii TaxID=229202 RepID=A0ACB7XYF0_9ERIC|nr:hypothetical protein Vadar_012236 [Vaccinium darrowii]